MSASLREDLSETRPPDASGGRPGRDARLAALDLGTNNCRLLIAVPDGAGFRVVDSFSRIVRLGEGLAATNRLGDAAMERTLAALRICGHLMGRHRVTHVRCVATEACRRAENGPEFIRRVRRATGIRLELLDHEREARLAMLGCLPLMEPDADQVVIVDIGGGSTEVMWLDRWRSAADQPAEALGHAISMPLGVVTLSETLGHDGGRGGYEGMVAHVHERLLATGIAERRPPPARRLQMIGTSGTVTTLAALHLGLRRYDRRKVDGVRVTFPAVQTVARRLREMADEERAAHPCIGPGRSDLVIAGCAILDAVFRVWPVDDLRVADRGLREGILGELTGQSLRQALLPLPPDADAAAE